VTPHEYGRLDVWKSGTVDPAQTRELAERLELRAQSADEVATRAAYLDLLGVAPGMRVLDVGCGTGAVSRDLARRVGPTGRVVGVDPSPVFLQIARELAGRDGLATLIDFRPGDARDLPFGDAEFDAAVAATVLSHVPEGARAVPEMARVVRPGGRVGVFDLDTDSLIIAHPDRALTRRVVAAHSDHAVTDGWLGRRLPGLFAAAGLRDIGVRALTPIERDPAGFYAGVAERAARIAVETGVMTEEERRRWWDALCAEVVAGRFLAGRTHLFVWGTRPATDGPPRP
jgi:ubiquinone/menaquinone biosynthesis C-methylase UbiE